MIDRNAIFVGIATILFIIFGLYYGNFLKRSFVSDEIVDEEPTVEVTPTIEPTPLTSPTPTISVSPTPVVTP